MARYRVGKHINLQKEQDNKAVSFLWKFIAGISIVYMIGDLILKSHGL